jgi:hypothetical protein
VKEKGFRKWMEDRKDAQHLGKVAVFYVPSKKVNKEVAKEIHDFFVSKHRAYTHESGGIKGFWHDGERLTRDSHERYEISFKGEDKFREFLDFLSGLCGRIGEKSIYMTMADESYLIRPKT